MGGGRGVWVWGGTSSLCLSALKISEGKENEFKKRIGVGV